MPVATLEIIASRPLELFQSSPEQVRYASCRGDPVGRVLGMQPRDQLAQPIRDLREDLPDRAGRTPSPRSRTRRSPEPPAPRNARAGPASRASSKARENSESAPERRFRASGGRQPPVRASPRRQGADAPRSPFREQTLSALRTSSPPSWSSYSAISILARGSAELASGPIVGSTFLGFPAPSWASKSSRSTVGSLMTPLRRSCGPPQTDHPETRHRRAVTRPRSGGGPAPGGPRR